MRNPINLAKAAAVAALSVVLQSVSANATQSALKMQIANDAISATFQVAGNTVNGLIVTDRLHGKEIFVATPFAILLKDGNIYSPGKLTLAGVIAKHELSPHPDASRLADRLKGQSIDVPLESPNHSLRIVWSLVLLDNSTYLRQVLTITAVDKDVPIRRVQLIDLVLPDARVSGSVEGSPIVAGDLFLGFEHPLSHSEVRRDRATAWIDRDLPLRNGQTITYSSVIGVARSGQLRRDFLAYIEQERAHPYRTFLHYNSWYDLGYFNPYDEAGALDRVNTFGRELAEKRGVKLDSFLFDDGWDSHKSLWKFNDGFPNGFTPVKQAAEKYGADPGVWMSPWGGYSKPKHERIAFGTAA